MYVQINMPHELIIKEYENHDRQSIRVVIRNISHRELQTLSRIRSRRSANTLPSPCPTTSPRRDRSTYVNDKTPTSASTTFHMPVKPSGLRQSIDVAGPSSIEHYVNVSRLSMGRYSVNIASMSFDDMYTVSNTMNSEGFITLPIHPTTWPSGVELCVPYRSQLDPIPQHTHNIVWFFSIRYLPATWWEQHVGAGTTLSISLMIATLHAVVFWSCWSMMWIDIIILITILYNNIYENCDYKFKYSKLLF